MGPLRKDVAYRVAYTGACIEKQKATSSRAFYVQYSNSCRWLTRCCPRSECWWWIASFLLLLLFSSNNIIKTDVCLLFYGWRSCDSIIAWAFAHAYTPINSISLNLLEWSIHHQPFGPILDYRISHTHTNTQKRSQRFSLQRSIRNSIIQMCQNVLINNILRTLYVLRIAHWTTERLSKCGCQAQKVKMPEINKPQHTYRAAQHT